MQDDLRTDIKSSVDQCSAFVVIADGMGVAGGVLNPEAIAQSIAGMHRVHANLLTQAEEKWGLDTVEKILERSEQLLKADLRLAETEAQGGIP